MASQFVKLPASGGSGGLTEAEVDALIDAALTDYSTTAETESLIGTELADYSTTASLANSKIAAISFTFDGSGHAVEAGTQARIRVPYACTINAATLLADVSGAAVVDIWKVAYASYPPADGNSITSATPPTLSGTASSENTTLSSWTTSVAAGDTIIANVDSCSTITKLTLVLKVTKT